MVDEMLVRVYALAIFLALLTVFNTVLLVKLSKLVRKGVTEGEPRSDIGSRLGSKI
jgi:hypothetical protein